MQILILVPLSNNLLSTKNIVELHSIPTENNYALNFFRVRSSDFFILVISHWDIDNGHIEIARYATQYILFEVMDIVSC